MSAPELPDIFGNYVLGDFVEVVSPSSISWWPQTAGWYWMGTALAIWLLYRGSLYLRHWYRNRYRKEACARLQQLPTGDGSANLVAEINRLLKLTALSAFSRDQVARLSGRPWPEFLNAQCTRVVFDEAQRELLATGAYASTRLEPGTAQQLIASSMDWVRQHKNRYDD